MNLQKSFLSVFFVTLFGLTMAGCQTVTMPAGPDTSTLQPIADAPVVAVSVVDNRGSDKLGNIGATTVKALRTETVNTAENYLNQFLHANQVNAIKIPNLNATDHAAISEVIGAYNADAAALYEIHGISVKSFDLILSPPKYELQGTFYLFSKEGKPIFHQDVSTKTGSQSVSKKGQGEAVAQMINDSIWSLEQNPKFREQVTALKA